MAVVARDNDKLLDDLQRSGLVEEERLNQFLADQGLEADGEFLLHELVEAGLVTPWQSERLLSGKWKDFFLGKYKLLSLLGAGGMGSVYLAEHKVMRHRVAIKVLAKHLMEVPNIVARFEREARAAARIHHPNVVRAYDIDHEGNVHFLVMEYVQGEDLKQIVECSGPLDPRVAAEYIQQVARGLHEAHRNGLIHRDIKPANLLLDQSGLIKILDLGLARLEDEEVASATLMQEAKVLGTVDYLAPEQARNSHNIDGRADLYSLGCTLYFLLTGVPPFPTGSIAERMLKHQTRRPLDIRKRRPGVPDALVNLGSRLMEKHPDRRFATAGEAATAFADYLAGRYDFSNISEDELLSFAEDADATGSGISRKASQSSKLGRGGSSTAAGSAPSSNTVPDQLDLVPDAAAKSSTKQLPVAKALPEQPAKLPDIALAPLAPTLDPLAAGGQNLMPLSLAGNVFEQLPPAPMASTPALPPLDDALSGLSPLGSNPLSLGDPLSSPLGPALGATPLVQRKEPTETQYPLWALLGIGLILGLVFVGVGVLLYFAFQ